MKKNKTLFLDRDGTINIDMQGGYVTKPAELKLIPGTAKAIKKAVDHGFKIAIITNQQGIARGLYSETDLQLIHREMENQIAKENGLHSFLFDCIEFCPHFSKDACECRKPKPGMVLRAMNTLNTDPEKSFYVGDKDADLLCAADAGIRSILVRTGYGVETEKEISTWNASKPICICDDLNHAIDYILSH